MASGDAPGLTMRWSPSYQPAWDAAPDAYVEAGVVAPERTRRLLRADDPRLGMKAYIGVRHSDPSRYGLPGEAHASFFLSVLLGKRTLYLHTHPTIPAALDELRRTHARLAAQGG
ncbi:MAG TPA: hypothetical protein VFU60_07875 [Ktedonobacterales bacterium]|nr:hypothetical protein [Ktedonobacterales bacterium]